MTWSHGYAHKSQDSSAIHCKVIFYVEESKKKSYLEPSSGSGKFIQQNQQPDTEHHEINKPLASSTTAPTAYRLFSNLPSNSMPGLFLSWNESSSGIEGNFSRTTSAREDR
ncbi:hypothetical protein PIB30_007862 [Stylosanthes scabra]|uniref:Uncharacterized protein n=1 Tax=Stylosanthes scabra TaxID=79078 RepID=A0ABU6R529_9FABA|nr:hypothetical protein [Stylosanthes scabra]